MALFAFGAGVAGRQNSSFLALFFAAWLMIFWDPTVATSISFILSFAATLGIVLLDPIFKLTILKQDVLEDFRTTLSAQISTTPILLFSFGTYAPISIVTNLLVLWTVPPLMVLGMIAAVLFWIPILAAPFVYLCLPLLNYFWAVIDFFAARATPITIENIPWTLIVGYYLILGSAIIYFHKRRKVPRLNK